MEILRTHRGNTIESQEIRKELTEIGLKFCGICHSIKALTSFHMNRSNLDGRHGVCRACDGQNKNRTRNGMNYFMFTGAERDARYRDRMTPDELAAYSRSGIPKI